MRVALKTKTSGSTLNFRKKVVWLAFGVMGSQALSVLASPILTRLYSPSAFGTYGVLLAIVSIASVFVTLRYERGIMIASSASERNGLAALILVLGLIVLALGIVCGIFYYVVFQEPVNVLTGVAWALLLALCVTFGGVGLAGRFIALKGKGYRWITSIAVGASTFQIAVQVAIGFLAGGPPLGLPIGSAIGLGIVAIGFYVLAHREGWLNFRKYKPTRQRIMAVARRYSEFPIRMTWSGVANSASPQLMVLITGTLLTPAAAGQIFLAQRVIKLPMTLLGGTISDANMEETANMPRSRVRTVYRRRARKLALLGLPPLGLMLLFGPQVFQIVFGHEWRPAGVVLRILVPGLFFQFVFTPFCPLFTVLRRQDTYFYWSSGRLILAALLTWFGTAWLGMYGAAVAYSVSTAIAFIILIFLLEYELSDVSFANARPPVERAMKARP